MAGDLAVGPDGYLDMTRFPDGDPDAVLAADVSTALRTTLLDDDVHEPDAERWQALVEGVTSGAQDEPDADGPFAVEGVEGVTAFGQELPDDPAALDLDASDDPGAVDDEVGGEPYDSGFDRGFDATEDLDLGPDLGADPSIDAGSAADTGDGSGFEVDGDGDVGGS